MQYGNDYFLNKVKGKYEEIDYSFVEYKSVLVKVKLRCTKHDLTYLQTPKDHYKAKGCKLCSDESRMIPFEKWVKNSKEKYNSKYSYDHLTPDDYIYNHEIEVNCNHHGLFKVNTQNHMLGRGNCKKCVGKERKSKEELVSEMNDIHNCEYDYIFPDVWNMQTKIEIICKKHGRFKASIKNHLANKSKCPSCSKENNGWSKSCFINSANGKKCLFYTLLCYNEHEYFYKIGITSKSIKERYSGKSLPYKYVVLSTIEGDAETIWNIEKERLKQLKKYHYKPMKKFKGSVKECIKI